MEKNENFGETPLEIVGQGKVGKGETSSSQFEGLPDGFMDYFTQQIEKEKYIGDINRKMGKNPKGGTGRFMTKETRDTLRAKRKKHNKHVKSQTRAKAK